ncbi:MAG: sporulation protein YqfD, partial [Alicyclobacillus sp.]|nr:sporulation protein YqfD [Alicyclobacillus sp.]
RSRIPSPEELQADILEKVPSLSWVGIRLEGAKAKLEAVVKIPPAQPEAGTPRNIVAGKPGVILRVLATRGDVLVKPGQVVSPGTVLISGSLAEGAKRVPAAGHAWAEVWYHTEVVVPLQVSRRELTGRKVTRRYLDLAGVGVPVWGWADPAYAASVDRASETDWHLGPWHLPVQLRTVQEYEVNLRTWSQTVDDAKRTGMSLAAQDVTARMGAGGRVLGQTILQSQVAHGKLYATVMTRTEEDIGVPSPIPETPPDGAHAGEPQG